MRGGTLTEIKKWFDGMIGNVAKAATIIKDSRKD
jgi:hypothetical protein